MAIRLNFLHAATLALAATCVPASAALLTFEDLPHEYELQGVGDAVYAQQFVIQYAPAAGEPYPVGLFSVGKMWRFNGRSTALVANSCSATVTLKADDNNPVSLVSIDLAELNGDPDVRVDFEGVTTDGQIVQHGWNLNSRRVWQTVYFPFTFRRLQYVRWTQGDCIVNKPHMFDNVRVFKSVPAGAL